MEGAANRLASSLENCGTVMNRRSSILPPSAKQLCDILLLVRKVADDGLDDLSQRYRVGARISRSGMRVLKSLRA